MTFAVSTIPTARAALLAQLESRISSDVQVLIGDPMDTERPEVVAVSGLEDPVERQFTFGTYQEENYGIRVRLKVHQPAAKSEVEVETRLFELSQEVRAAVYSDRSLDGTVLTARVDRQSTPDLPRPAMPAQDGGYVGFLEVVVRCLAVVS